MGVNHCLCTFPFIPTDFMQQGDCICFRHQRHCIALSPIAWGNAIISGCYKNLPLTPVIIPRFWQERMKSCQTCLFGRARNGTLVGLTKKMHLLTSGINSVNNQKPIWGLLGESLLHVNADDSYSIPYVARHTVVFHR